MYWRGRKNLPPSPQMNSLLILVVDVLWGYPLLHIEQLEMLEMVFHVWLMKSLHILWIEPMHHFHGDLADIPLEEPAHPVFACCPLCES